MAKYQVTHTCGHVATHSLIGPSRTREYRLERLGNEVCEPCRVAAREQANRIAAERDAELNAELGLPTLLGTERQVSWAETIRRSFVTMLEKCIKELHEKTPDLDLVRVLDNPLVGLLAVIDCYEDTHSGEETNREITERLIPNLLALRDWITSETVAKNWIDHRETPLSKIRDLIEYRKKEREREIAAEMEKEAKQRDHELLSAAMHKVFQTKEERGYGIRIEYWRKTDDRIYFVNADSRMQQNVAIFRDKKLKIVNGTDHIAEAVPDLEKACREYFLKHPTKR